MHFWTTAVKNSPVKRAASARLLLPCYALAATAVLLVAMIDVTPRELLDEAVGEYRSALDCTDREQRVAKFRHAELLFARLANGEEQGAGAPGQSIHNPNLYVNLGNAALGAEQLGPAILAYRRALQLDPNHHRARQNLVYARTLLPDWVPRPEEGGWFDTFFAWSNRLTHAEFEMLAAVTFLIATGLLAGSIYWRQTGLRNLAVIPACFWLLLLGLMLFNQGRNSRGAAVVIVPEVVARSADWSAPLPDCRNRCRAARNLK